MFQMNYRVDYQTHLNTYMTEHCLTMAFEKNVQCIFNQSRDGCTFACALDTFTEREQKNPTLSDCKNLLSLYKNSNISVMPDSPAI